MMRKLARWGVLVIAGLTASIVLWPSGPTAVGQQPACRLADPPLQPSEPLEMNTVTVGRLFKSVVMEKEVFVCVNDAGTPTRIVDVETFIEIIERATTEQPGAKIVEKRVEIATCVKDFDASRVTCGVRDRRLSTTDAPLEGCQPDLEGRRAPSDPVVMNTERAGRIVKTIKVEKEVLPCGNLIADLYLFTEIIEAPRDVAGLGTTMRPVQKQFEGIICYKDEAAATILRCRQFTPPPLT